MSRRERVRGANAEELRREFDRSFALPARVASADLEDVLALRVAFHGYAVRSRELSGVAVLPKITQVPSPTPGLLGLVGVRGALVPVFGLPQLLGYEPGTEALRWLLLLGAEEPLALAFHALESFGKVPKSAFSADVGRKLQGEHVEETVTLAGSARPVIAVTELAATIRSRLGRRRPEKEE